ncbi:hypothetical protein Salat_0657200 [Sesamum alatum]|uniref:Uncharacterized protein n=1 Tax=Sesamum alatum TaxID=300844 RepID=A0AAE2CUF6_9LAMI|nr:hypothetical protein Salat_0657200 [Sesamum alatum]
MANDGSTGAAAALPPPTSQHNALQLGREVKMTSPWYPTRWRGKHLGIVVYKTLLASLALSFVARMNVEKISAGQARPPKLLAHLILEQLRNRISRLNKAPTLELASYVAINGGKKGTCTTHMPLLQSNSENDLPISPNLQSNLALISPHPFSDAICFSERGDERLGLRRNHGGYERPRVEW